MQEGGRSPRPRIETLADLIFGVSLGIGSLVLISELPTSAGEINGHIAAFVFTFLILITAWIIYTTDMSVLPVETNAVTFLNIALLLLVALVPYLLNGVELANPSITSVQESSVRDYASSLFALDLTGILLILAVFAHVISSEEKKLVAPQLVTLFRNGRNRLLVLAFVMGATILPVFWQVSLLGTPIRLYAWYLPLISYWVGRVVRPLGRSYTES